MKLSHLTFSSTSSDKTYSPTLTSVGASTPATDTCITNTCITAMRRVFRACVFYSRLCLVLTVSCADVQQIQIVHNATTATAKPDHITVKLTIEAGSLSNTSRGAEVTCSNRSRGSFTVSLINLVSYIMIIINHHHL